MSPPFPVNSAPMTLDEAIQSRSFLDYIEPEATDAVNRLGFPFPAAITYPAYCEALFLCSSEALADDGTIHPGLVNVLVACRAAISADDSEEVTRFDVAKVEEGRPRVQFECVRRFDRETEEPELVIRSIRENALVDSIAESSVMRLGWKCM